MTLDDPARGGRATALAQQLFLLTIFSLGFMQPGIKVAGFEAVPTDLLYLLTAAAWSWALLSRQMRLVWDNAYWLLLAYFAALAVSAVAAGPSARGGIKLLTQVYLLSLPVLAVHLVPDAAALRRACRWWLAAAAVVSVIAVLSIALFLVDPQHPLLKFTRFYFGTLPPGGYLRLCMTFLNGNMACNYLTLSLLILLAARALGWVSARQGSWLLGGVLLAAAFTISPGLGGVALALASWGWFRLREQRPRVARLVLGSGVAAAAAMIVAMSLTPLLHPTAPSLIRVPLLGLELAPAGRALTWASAARNFLEHPWTGHGIGAEAAEVRFVDPSGMVQKLTDAHNTFLNVAAQAGIFGLLALSMILLHAWRLTCRADSNPDGVGLVQLALGLALLNGMAYQGLGGSFEDARHLWVAYGLLLVARRVAASGHSAEQAAVPAHGDRATRGERPPPTNSA